MLQSAGWLMPPAGCGSLDLKDAAVGRLVDALCRAVAVLIRLIIFRQVAAVLLQHRQSLCQS